VGRVLAHGLFAHQLAGLGCGRYPRRTMAITLSGRSITRAAAGTNTSAGTGTRAAAGANTSAGTGTRAAAGANTSAGTGTRAAAMAAAAVAVAAAAAAVAATGTAGKGELSREVQIVLIERDWARRECPGEHADRRQISR
jgi:hypothetical protein